MSFPTEFKCPCCDSVYDDERIIEIGYCPACNEVTGASFIWRNVRE